MFTLRRARLSFSLCVTLFSVLLALPYAAVAATPADQEPLKVLETFQQGFRTIHDRVAPAVVSITTRMETDAGGGGNNPLDDFFNGSQEPQITTASGSGVIIRPEGIIVTNSHVVENATKVTVQLSGSTKSLPAEVVQSDRRTDLAVVRITEKGQYPTVPLGDASTVRVGDWAVAFGSPFRLASTMTVGVISATGRELRGPDDEFTYRDLLQTDASINPGNSGGPLVNIKGEVVGINFMIFTPDGRSGSVGIGFAIPINEYTKKIIDTLVTGKTIERGLLGIYVKDLDDAMREQYGVPQGGVFVDSTMPGQAADKAGIKPEDIITEFNGTKITSLDQFLTLVEQTPPGTKVNVTIVREKKPQQVAVVIGSMDQETAKVNLDERKVGMSVTTLTPELAQKYRLKHTSGVLVTAVMPGSAADDAGLRAGDIIVRVQAEEVKTEEDFWPALSKSMGSAKYGVLLRVRRGSMDTTLTMPVVKDDETPEKGPGGKEKPKPDTDNGTGKN